MINDLYVEKILRTAAESQRFMKGGEDALAQLLDDYEGTELGDAELELVAAASGGMSFSRFMEIAEDPKRPR